MAEPQTVGERIKRAREARYIRSARELARLVNESGFSITPQAISRIEGGAVPRPALLSAISAVLGMSLYQGSLSRCSPDSVSVVRDASD